MAEQYRVFRTQDASEIARHMNEAADEGYHLRDFQVRIFQHTPMPSVRGTSVHPGDELYVAVMVKVTQDN